MAIQKPATQTRLYLTYAITPPAIATAVVVLLGRTLNETNAVLSVFFTVFVFTAITTAIIAFLPLITAAVERHQSRKSTSVAVVEDVTFPEA